MLSQKRRKRRGQHGLKTIELQRGEHGFGFTISGQQPCIIHNIVTGSPAEDQGLRDGDHLVMVNALIVSQLPHDQVVRLIGSSSGTLRLQIAEQSVRAFSANDSSDEEYVKPRYNPKGRPRSATKPSQSQDFTGRKMHRKDPRSSSPAVHQSGQTLSLSLPQRSLSAMRDPFPTVYNPTRPINGRSSDFGAARPSKLQIVETRIGDQRQFDAGLRSGGPTFCNLNRSNSVPDVSAMDGLPAKNSQQQLSEMLYPAMQPMQAQSSSSTINVDSDSPTLRVIVGYIGSIEMPQNANQHSARLQSIRSAVRRLRVEQKVHTLVLLEIRSDGIKLINPMGVTIVHYPVERLAMSGMYPDDKRFFGLVTVHEQDEDDEDVNPSSSCHVFMVDPEFATHTIHVGKAKTFGIHCTIDPTTQRCIEFPKSCTPILRTAARLYRDRHGGIFEVPRAQREERRVSSDSDTNSDSGVGFHKELDDGQTGDRVYVVDVHIPDSTFAANLSPTNSGDRVVSPPGASGLQRSETPIKASPVSSRGSGHGFPSGPSVRRAMSPAMELEDKPVTVRAKTDRRGNVFDIRATDGGSNISASISPAAVSMTQSPLDPHTVEQLTKNMQRLLAKRQESVKDTQSLSDTESMLSESYSRSSGQGVSQSQTRLAVPKQHHGVVPAPRKSKSSDSDSSSVRYKTPLRPASVQPNHPAHHAMRAATLNGPPTRTPQVPPKPTRPQDIMQRFADDTTGAPSFYAQRSAAILKAQSLDTRQRPALPSYQHALASMSRSELRGDHHADDSVEHRPKHRPERGDERTAERGGERTAERGGERIAERGGERVLKRIAERGIERGVVEPRLSSKLSPRAYPQHFNKPPPVSTSERSAFQKVSPEHQPHSHHYNRNNSNSNGASSQAAPNSQSQASNHDNQPKPLITQMKPYVLAGMDSQIIGTRKPDRPVPAPRMSRVKSQPCQPTSPRSCSVPPREMLRWYERSREVNVDDGLSVRSNSDASSHEKNGRAEHGGSGRSSKQRAVTLDRSRPYTDKALSIESLVDVGHSRTGHTTLPKQVVINNNNVGRVASWAVTFENLLQDPHGLEAFTEFLNKEFSQENIDFWLACEQYKSLNSTSQLREKANEIYGKHLCRKASEPVNIDSNAMKLAEDGLNNPVPTIFREAQHQVFTLMKTDSYSRFIKSEFYQSYLMREFEHDKTLRPPTRDKSKGNLSDVSDTDTQKKRSLQGFLKDISRTWTSSRSSNRSADGLQKQWSRSSDESSVEKLKVSANQKDEGDGEERLLRVVMPNGSTSVVQAKPNDTVRGILVTLLNKKSDLSIAAIDVFPMGSDRSIEISQPVRNIDDQEFRVERRVLFRLDLPNRKSVGVKAKPERSARDVLRPILYKYGYEIDNVVITLAGEVIAMDSLVSSIDNCRLSIMTKEAFNGHSKPKKEWGLGTRKNNSHDLMNGFDDMVDFEKPADLTQSTTTKKSKGAQLLGLLKNHSTDDAALRRSKGKSVTFGPALSMDDRIMNRKSSDDLFLDMLTKAQSSRFNDQRGINITVGDLPDFLKTPSDSQSETTNSETDEEHSTNHSQHNNSAQFSDMTTPKSSRSALKPSISINASQSDSAYFSYTGNIPDLNSTLTTNNNSPNKTLTPGAEPGTPLPPPPPQFGNECNTPHRPPPYREAISRASLALSFNSSGSLERSPLNNSTIPGNTAGNRLSFAHYNPMIINDDSVADSGSERSTPSPTTHSLILAPEDQLPEQSSNDSNPLGYSFYEREYARAASGSRTVTKTTPTEPVKVTFV